MSQPNNDETMRFLPAQTYARPRDQFDARPPYSGHVVSPMPPAYYPPVTPAKPKMKRSRIVVLCIAAVVLVAVAAASVYHFTTGIDAAGTCETAISAQLKSPSTAKFSNVQTQTLPTFTNVTGSVDSENGFSAMIRSSFNCSIGTDGSVTSATVS